MCLIRNQVYVMRTGGSNPSLSASTISYIAVTQCVMGILDIAVVGIVVVEIVLVRRSSPIQDLKPCSARLGVVFDGPLGRRALLHMSRGIPLW